MYRLKVSTRNCRCAFIEGDVGVFITLCSVLFISFHNLLRRVAFIVIYYLFSSCHSDWRGTFEDINADVFVVQLLAGGIEDF